MRRTPDANCERVKAVYGGKKMVSKVVTLAKEKIDSGHNG